MTDPSPSLLLARATRQLTSGGIETPAADARMLLCEALDVQPAKLIFVSSVSPHDEDRFNEMVERRRSGEPTQYIVGHAWFRGLRLDVGPGVFIPRLETELVAECAVDEARRLVMAGSAPSVIDPDLALFSGDDGLDLPRRLIDRAAQLLVPGGLFVMEHDDTQREAVTGCMAMTAQWDEIKDHDDLAGRPRFVTARRRCKDV